MSRKVLLPYLCGLILMAATAGPQATPAFQVVVHEDNAVSSISAAKLSRLFLRKISGWDDGSEAKPVDQAPTAAVRESFSLAVHGRDVLWVKSYWQKLIFAGRDIPPPEISSDGEVLSYVRLNRGAVGYVARGTTLGAGVKTIAITD